jgi:hypothetical protein
LLAIELSGQSTKRTGQKNKSASEENQNTMSINPETVQKAIDQIVTTLNNPDYKDQLTKLTQISVNNTVKTAQRLNAVTNRMSRMDHEEMTELVGNSIGDMMQLYIQFNTELVTLVQKTSNRAVDIIENSTPGTE